MSRATNAGGSLSSMGKAPASRRPSVDAGLILRLKERGLGVQNIALQTGFSMEDVRRVLVPKASNDAAPAPAPIIRAEPKPSAAGAKPRDLTEHDHFVLSMVEAGEVSQYAAAALMNCTSKSVRRHLDRRADERLKAAA